MGRRLRRLGSFALGGVEAQLFVGVCCICMAFVAPLASYTEHLDLFFMGLHT
jgi:hypothetical protein